VRTAQEPSVPTVVRETDGNTRRGAQSRVQPDFSAALHGTDNTARTTVDPFSHFLFPETIATIEMLDLAEQRKGERDNSEDATHGLLQPGTGARTSDTGPNPASAYAV